MGRIKISQQTGKPGWKKKNCGSCKFINGLLPVPPPVRITLPIVHVRYDALTPPPLRPAHPTAHLPPVPHFPPLPPTPSPSPLPPGIAPVSQ